MTSIVLFGSFGPPALAFARSCAANGMKVYLLEVGDGDVLFRNYSSALSGQRKFKRELVGSDTGLDEIKDYINKVDARGLISVSENNLLWLSKNRDRFEPACRVMAPDHDCLIKLASKCSQIEIAQKAGFELLPSTYLSAVSECRDIPANHFPLCVRPSNPTLVTPSFKARVIHSSEDLDHFMGNFRDISAPLIAQPFLQLSDLKVIGVCGENSHPIALQAFLVERKFEGVTLSLSKTLFPPNLDESCIKFLNLAGVTGPFHFDLLFSPEESRAYYLEINGRMGGITDKAKMFGFDQPAMIIEAYGLQKTLASPRKTSSSHRVVTKKAVVKHLLTAIRGGLTELDYPPVSRFRHIGLSLRDLIFAKDSVFDTSDLRGSFWFLFQRGQ